MVAVAGAACRRQAPPASGAASAVRIAAAADLRAALDEIIVAFGAEHPGVAASASYGSSGTFFAQLTNRAPFDLFLSADLAYPRQLVERGLTVPGSEFTYAVGRIVLWVPAASSIDVERLGMSALTAPGVSHVSIANPEHAPYGRAAESAMRSAGVYDRVRPTLVFGENVSQAMQFVQSGSADIGMVALSLALSPAAASAGRYVVVPPDTYPSLEQGGAILKWAADVDASRLFRSFLLGDSARTVLARYGFSLPGD